MPAKVIHMTIPDDARGHSDGVRKRTIMLLHYSGRPLRSMSEVPGLDLLTIREHTSSGMRVMVERLLRLLLSDVISARRS